MIYLLLGRRKKGKSTLAYYLARDPRFPRRLVFDPRGIFRRDGGFVATTAGELSQGVDALAEGEVGEVVYTPTESLDGIAFPAFAAEIRLWTRYQPDLKLAIVVDELSFLESSAESEDFLWALKTSNDKSLYFFLTCHRPREVPVPIRAISNYWYVFQTTQEHDLDVIKKRCGSDAAARVAKLTGYDVLCWDDSQSHATIYDRPADWFVPLSEPHRPARPAVLESSHV